MKFYLSQFYYQLIKLVLSILLVVGIVFVLPIAFVVVIFIASFEACLDLFDEFLSAEDENEKEKL